MDTLAPRSHILRGIDAAPYLFGAIDAPTDTVVAPFVPLIDAPPAPAGFVPLAETLAGPVRDEPAPAPVARPTYDDGVAAGHAAREDEVAALQAQVADLESTLAETQARALSVEAATDTLRGLWASAVKSLEGDLASLALDAAEAILAAPLTDAQRAASESALSHAVDALSDGAPITVSLHPVDLLHLREVGLADALEGAHEIRWDADEALAEGDWRASSTDGAVHRIRTEMLAALRDRLGLAPVSPAGERRAQDGAESLS